MTRLSLKTKKVARPQVFGQVVEARVAYSPVGPAYHHEPGVVPRLNRRLGDELRWQLVVEVAGLQSRSTVHLAALSVLRSSIAIVMGPTPPGTGVIAAAFSETAAKSTSPTSL